jgi:hypothetical protein
MIQLTNISNNTNQRIIQDLSSLGLEGNVAITLKYNFRFTRWIANIERLNSNGITTFEYNGVFLTPTVPLLYSFTAQDFDIVCLTSNNLPLFDIDDFISGSASGEDYGLFILTKDEALQYYTI